MPHQLSYLCYSTAPSASTDATNASSARLDAKTLHHLSHQCSKIYISSRIDTKKCSIGSRRYKKCPASALAPIDAFARTPSLPSTVVVLLLPNQLASMLMYESLDFPFPDLNSAAISSMSLFAVPTTTCARDSWTRSASAYTMLEYVCLAT